MNLNQQLLRPVLFRCDAEWTHETALRTCDRPGKSAWLLECLRGHFAFDDPRLACRIAGLAFPNSVGIPAGFDKDAHAVSSYKTHDGYINIAASGDAIWKRLCKVLGKEEWLGRAEFTTDALRVKTANP